MHFFKVSFHANFFCHELPQCPNTMKNFRHLEHPSMLDVNNFHIFLNIFLFFRFYCSPTYIFIVFPLSRAPGMSKQYEKLHAPCAREELWSHKFSDFFEFLSYFFSNLLFINLLFASDENRPNQHENLHTPCALEYLWSHKFSDFFDFVSYFFEFTVHHVTIHQTVNTLWPNDKGISIRWLDGRGVFSSIPGN